MFKDYLERVLYYRYRTNWHKHPWLSKVMCYLGRHDYEFVSAVDNHGTLECFYCAQQKGSTRAK